MGINLQHRILQHQRPFLIAGPCSVESEEQILHIAQQVKKNTTISLLRGGIWKPRTRPNSFEGVGKIGLDWLVNAGKQIGVPVTTEVANAKHVELALTAGVDVLWIGARTTVNPFAVQEIAEAVQGKSVSIMVKNPVNPDLQLWMGAIERLKNVGVKDVVAIHRGFSVYQHPKYRNAPNWKIPIALMEQFPDIPIICDPSHISGKRNGIFSIAQKAMDLNFAGLMIETHHQPDKAWSDAQQQITPHALHQLLNELILRKPKFKSTEKEFIEERRKQIAALDDKVFELFKNRMQIAEEIGEYKKKNNITILQTEHWKKIIEERLSNTNEQELTKEFLRIILDAIHQESIRHQVKVMNPKK